MVAAKSSWLGHVDRILELERSLRALLDQRLAPAGVTYAQFAQLRFIHAPTNQSGESLGRPCRAADIQAYFGFAPRTVSVAIRRLVAAKLIVKSAHPDDRRSFQLVLTDTGVACLVQGSDIVSQVCERVFSRLRAPQEVQFEFALNNIKRFAAAKRHHHVKQ